MLKRSRAIAPALLVALLLLPAANALAAPQYVALGDSYSAGVGSRVFYEETCFRSPDAYPPLIASARGYALSFEACSGATTKEVNEKQLGPLSSSTSLVTITIGGNDAGFSEVMLSCALYYFTCQESIEEADYFIRYSLPGLLNTTYSDIRARAGNARVVVLGYPHLFTSSGTTCNFNLLTSEHEKELNSTANILDQVISERAAAHGFTFVDPRKDFEAHEVCSSSEWLNGQSWPLRESYHPNQAGYRVFQSLIEAALP
ncbi:MAG TPA: SGNH/GDSL hydrolase family protein [Solirubrobacteraceae bacterium]|nr:SGNH/GDSL hydrolase family protein [Solirubrobacteraceae bacterium]